MGVESIRTKYGTAFSGANNIIRKTVEEIIARKLNVPENHISLSIQAGDPDDKYDIVVALNYTDLNYVKIELLRRFPNNPPVVDVRLP